MGAPPRVKGRAPIGRDTLMTDKINNPCIDLKELLEKLERISFKDAPLEYDSKEAGAWGIGYQTCRDRIQKFLNLWREHTHL